MKKKKRCTRVGAGALAAVLAVTAAGVSVPALAQQAVRTESQTQMSSDLISSSLSAFSFTSSSGSGYHAAFHSNSPILFFQTFLQSSQLSLPFLPNVLLQSVLFLHLYVRLFSGAIGAGVEVSI